MSQVDTKRIADGDAQSLIGQTLRFLVTDVREGGKSVVVSRRALLSREASDVAARAMSEVVPGAVLRGTVTGVRDFGAFIDLGGIEGLIPRSEVSHDRSVAVADALKPGDTVEVQVREVKDAEPSRAGAPGKRITLSLKALAADPWADLSLSPGVVIAAPVVRVTDLGCFVRVAEGIDGLLHASELPRGRKLEAGTELRVVAKKIDRASKKIALVLAPEGAQVGSVVAGTSLAVGAVVVGTVERIETFGVFVQIEGTADRSGRGLVPNAELGVPRGTDLRKAFPEGSKVKAKVLELGAGKLRLSIKGARDAEERADYEAARSKGAAPASLGTFADLLKGRKL